MRGRSGRGGLVAHRLRLMGWARAGLLVALASVVAVPGFGGVATKTKRVSVSSTGAQADGGSGGASISANGRFVAFASGATNLAGGDTNGVQDVFVRNLGTRTTKRVSVSSAGPQGDGNSFAPTISANGRFVAYASSATNLVGGDTNSGDDVFLRDRKTGKTRLLSRSSGGVEGNGFSD